MLFALVSCSQRSQEDTTTLYIGIIQKNGKSTVSIFLDGNEILSNQRIGSVRPFMVNTNTQKGTHTLYIKTSKGGEWKEKIQIENEKWCKITIDKEGEVNVKFQNEPWGYEWVSSNKPKEKQQP